MTDPGNTDALLSALALIRATTNRDPETFTIIHQAAADEQQAIITALTGLAASLIESRAEQLGVSTGELLDRCVRRLLTGQSDPPASIHWAEYAARYFEQPRQQPNGE